RRGRGARAWREAAAPPTRRVALGGGDDDLDAGHLGQSPSLAREEARGDGRDRLEVALVAQGPEEPPDEQTQVPTIEGGQDSPRERWYRGGLGGLPGWTFLVRAVAVRRGPDAGRRWGSR